MPEIVVRDPIEFRREVNVIASHAGPSTAAMLAAVFDQSPDCIEIIRLDGTLAYMNANGRVALELDRFDQVAGTNWLDLWAACDREKVTTAMAKARQGHIARVTVLSPTAKGNKRWWEVTVSPVFDDNGAVLSFVSISRDVTASKLDQDAVATMALEMRHRLRNAYSVSGALAKLAARDWPEHKEFAEQLAGRFQALSIVQGRLLDADGRVRVDELVSDLARAFAPAPDTIAVEPLPPLMIEDGMARIISVVLGELGTNSLKYGALARGGTIRLSGGADGDHLTLCWRESASGLEIQPAQALGRGSGYGLMSRMAATRGGSVSQRWDDEGLHVTLTLPLRR